MIKLAAVATSLAIIATPAFGQDATAIGTGVGVAKSSSSSNAVAISGQGGKGGQGGQGGTGVGVGVGGNPSATINIAGAPANTTQTINNTGTSTIKNVPSVFAPGLAAAGLETCLGSISGGGAFVGTGFSFGSTIPDPGCAARLDARTLWSFGLKRAAVARLCEGTDVYNAMPEVCGQYLPSRASAVAVAAPVGYPEPVGPAGYYYDDIDTYRGGSIMLVDGKTGKERLCTDYDKGHRRCRLWADAVSSKPKRVARAVRSETKTTAASPSPVWQVRPVDPKPTEPQPTSALEAPVPSAFKLTTPVEPVKGGPSIERKEVQNEESLVRCLGFCAAPR